MCNVYIINLKHENDKYENIIINLKYKKFDNLNRIDAVDGKKILDFTQYKELFVPYVYHFMPYGAIGGCISHYKTIETIYKKYVKKKEKTLNDEYALILEDDAIPLYEYSYIEDLLKNIPKDADIILLNRFEILQQKKYDSFFVKKTNNSAHPATSYIVKCKTIPKILNKKLFYYFDYTTFNCYKSLNIYFTNKDIFKTTFDKSNNLKQREKYDGLYILFETISKFLNIPNMSFFLSFKAIRIPILNIELNGLNIIYIIILFVVYFLSFSRYFY